jgi:hypothetical protein
MSHLHQSDLDEVRDYAASEADNPCQPAHWAVTLQIDVTH